MDKILKDYLDAKEAYEDAKDILMHFETLLVNKLGVKEEGATTHTLDGYKVTITGRINRKIDADKWEEIKASIPTELHPIKYKPELVIAEMRKLQSEFPMEYIKFSSCLTATNGKPSVSVSEKGE